MGLLNLFSKTAPALTGLPSGSFTLNRDGEIIISTIPSSFDRARLEDLGRRLLDSFREARDAQLPLSELVVHFGGLKIVAREMRGGAIIFLTPKHTITANHET